MSWSSSWVKYAVQDKHTPEPCESLRITWNLKRKTPTVQAPGYSSFSQDSTAVRQDPGPAPNLPAHFTAPGFSAGPSQDAAVPASRHPDSSSILCPKAYLPLPPLLVYDKHPSSRSDRARYFRISDKSLPCLVESLASPGDPTSPMPRKPVSPFLFRCHESQIMEKE